MSERSRDWLEQIARALQEVRWLLEGGFCLPVELFCYAAEKLRRTPFVLRTAREGGPPGGHGYLDAAGVTLVSAERPARAWSRGRDR